MRASSNGNLSIVKLLLEYGANPSSAVISKRLKILEFLLKYDYDLNKNWINYDYSESIRLANLETKEKIKEKMLNLLKYYDDLRLKRYLMLK